MARRTRFITVLISFLAFFVLTRARQRGRLAREPCESETTPSPLERGSRAPLAFSHIHRPTLRLVRAPHFDPTTKSLCVACSFNQGVEWSVVQCTDWGNRHLWQPACCKEQEQPRKRGTAPVVRAIVVRFKERKQ